MRSASWAGVTMVLLMMLGGAIAAEPQQCLLSPLPANIEFPRDLEPAIHRVYDRSPTFRAQCERIAAADHLRIDVRIDTAIPVRCRAFTVVQRRRDGRIRADMHLPPGSDHAELIAHELEHVIEQLEGLNLRRMARVKGSEVREVARELFETDRAQADGRVMVAEASGWPRAPQAD